MQRTSQTVEKCILLCEKCQVAQHILISLFVASDKASWRQGGTERTAKECKEISLSENLYQSQVMKTATAQHPNWTNLAVSQTGVPPRRTCLQEKN